MDIEFNVAQNGRHFCRVQTGHIVHTDAKPVLDRLLVAFPLKDGFRITASAKSVVGHNIELSEILGV